MVGKRMTKKIKFMGQEIEISKLSVSQVMEIQNMAQKAENDEDEGFNVLKTVIRFAVADAETLTDEDFESFPLSDISSLSEQIMKFSGIGDGQGK